jgi:hypothetical protein
MINIMDYYKNVSYYVNNLKLRSIFSILTIGIFIFLGFASIEEYPPLNCKFNKPPITKTHKITINFLDKQTGKPIVGEIISYSIYKLDKVDNNDGFCQLTENLQGSWYQNSGAYGKIIITQNATYYSPDDQLNIWVELSSPNYNKGLRVITLRDFHSDLTFEITYLRKEVYP